MAEAVGLVASVIAIIDLSAKLASRCKFYVENAKDARVDFRKILFEVTFVGNAIGNLQFLIDHDPDFESDQLSTLSGDSGPIPECLDALKRLEALIPHPEAAGSGDPNRTLKKKMKDITTRLAWPLKKSRAMATLDEITKHKTNILLIIMSDVSQDVKDIKVAVREVQQRLSLSEKGRILNWLTDLNPSVLHHTAFKLYENGTGDWVLRDPSWKAWIDAAAETPRCLWLNGIPGAGKTVLMASLFHRIVEAHRAMQHSQGSQKSYPTAHEEVSTQRRGQGAGLLSTSLSIAHVYYYCHYTHDRDEALPMLRWVINQLCRQSGILPQQLVDLHKSGCQPSIEQLLDILEASIQFYDKVYLLIDALDESMPRTNLLSLLNVLSAGPRFRDIKLLASSRIYRDIAVEMEQFSDSINMSGPLVQEDIRMFTFNDLERRRAKDFGHLDQHFMDHAANVIASKADGMFRWAVLQIDTLRRLRFKEESLLRGVLETMPKGLDAAYERIFELISKNSDDQGRSVRDALSWICHHTNLYHQAGISMKILIQALHPDTTKPEASDKYFLRKSAELHEMLGCLVRFDTGLAKDEGPGGWPCQTVVERPEQVYLAHYTVAEYLTSERIQATLAKTFIPTERKVFFLSILENTLQTTDAWKSCAWPPHEQSFEAYQLWLSFAILVQCEKQEDLSLELSSQIRQFFDPTGQHFQAVRQFALVARLIDFSGPICNSSSLQLRADTSHEGWALIATARTIMALLEHGFLSLAESLLAGLEAPLLKALLTTPIHWRSGFNSGNKKPSKKELWAGISYEFTGTLPQWVATQPSFRGYYVMDGSLPTCWNAFTTINLRFAEYYVRETEGLLLDVVSSHGGVFCEWCDHRGVLNAAYRCIIAEMVGQGADPQPASFSITPLQIAVSRNDFYGVMALLEAGVDCNGHGTPGGYVYGSREPLSRFNSLHGMTPLYIYEKTQKRPTSKERYSFGKNRRIGRLLRDYGARAERVSYPGHVAGCEVVEDVTSRQWDGRSDDELSTCEVDHVDSDFDSYYEASVADSTDA